MVTADEIEKIKQHPEAFKVLQLVPFQTINSYPHLLDEESGDEIPIAVIDLETTGFDKEICEVIEFGWTCVGYSPSKKKITVIHDAGSMLQRPNEPITPEITEVTGITNEMVQDQRFDESKIQYILTAWPMYVVAHNLNFDKGFIEYHFAHLLKGSSIKWGCTLTQIDWAKRKFSSKSLEMLLLKTGYFYSAHRAHHDTNATAFLLDTIPDAFDELINKINTQFVTIYATGSPYSAKDILKNNSFKWDADNKIWRITVAESEVNDVLDKMDSWYYNGGKMARTETLPVVAQY